MTANRLADPTWFSEALFEKMQAIHDGIQDLELYEFRYGLNNLVPEEGGWPSVVLESCGAIVDRINRREFYEAIQLKPRVGDRIVLDPAIVQLTNMLFVGLVADAYPVEWVRAHFYFDIRGFFFLTRTRYFTEAVLAHLGGRPFQRFEQKQIEFERAQSLGYKEFKTANAKIDQAFIESVHRLVSVRGTPIILALAGPTAAGKTEIVERLRESFARAGQKTTAIEMDHFLTDRDYREAKGIHSLGREAIHLALFLQSLEEIRQGRRIITPRYDFVFATSSHDLDGQLKPGSHPIEIEPADVVFLEGNFPFLLEEVAPLIGVKGVYLTDDPVRMKRKWRRDIDYRKKYEPTYFRNRYFRNQFLMAHTCYIPQMQVCDLVVDTTGAALWTTPEVAALLR